MFKTKDDEDTIFTKRSDRKQEESDEKLDEHGITKPSERAGSQFAMGLFTGIIASNHPVEELYNADLL